MQSHKILPAPHGLTENLLPLHPVSFLFTTQYGLLTLYPNKEDSFKITESHNLFSVLCFKRFRLWSHLNSGHNDYVLRPSCWPHQRALSSKFLRSVWTARISQGESTAHFYSWVPSALDHPLLMLKILRAAWWGWVPGLSGHIKNPCSIEHICLSSLCKKVLMKDLL